MHENKIEIFHFKHDVKIIISNFLFNFKASIGGCRHQPYDTFHSALNDCYDLSKAMALKAYHLGIHFGGAKSVIYNPNALPFEAIAPNLGEAINSLKGAYIASIDIGVGSDEIDQLSKYTDHVYGSLEHEDPSESTAKGVIESIKYTASLIDKPFSKITVAIQGLGKVGRLVAKYCLEAGLHVFGADIVEEKINIYSTYPNFNKKSIDEILITPCDILIPCAGGNVINESNIDMIKADYICAGANNPIANPEKLTDVIAKKNIIFFPDFITNSGGLLNVANALEKNSNKHLSIESIPKKIHSLLSDSKDKNLYNDAIKQFKADI